MITSFPRAELNRMHRAATNPHLDRGMRAILESKIDSREAKRRMDIHSAAAAKTVDCKNRADRYFARLNTYQAAFA